MDALFSEDQVYKVVSESSQIMSEEKNRIHILKFINSPLLNIHSDISTSSMLKKIPPEILFEFHLQS